VYKIHLGGLTICIKIYLQLVLVNLLHSSRAAATACVVSELGVYADSQLAISSCDEFDLE
jgi:hypothetical protein